MIGQHNFHHYKPMTSEVYQIVDIYTLNDSVCIKTRSETQTKTFTIDNFNANFFIYVKNWVEKDYEQRKINTISSKLFMEGFQRYTVIFGEINYTPNTYLDCLKKYTGFRLFDNKIEFIEQFKLKYELHVGDLIEANNPTVKIIDEKSKQENFNYWKYAALEVKIEPPTRRVDPVSNWKYKAACYNCDYLEVCDEDLQPIIFIKIALFESNTEFKQEIIFEGSEFNLIEKFISYFKFLDIDCLICWKYDTGLQYIKERWDYLGGDVDYFKKSIYKSTNPPSIYVRNVKYESPIMFNYISIFYLYFTLDAKCGFTEKTISTHCYQTEIVGTTFYIKMFKDRNYFNWMIKSGSLFKTSFRNMIGSTSMRIYIYLIYILKKSYLIENIYHHYTKKKEKYIGAKTFDVDYNLLSDVNLIDIVAFYPRIIIQHNICPTTVVTSQFVNATSIKLEETEKRKRTEEFSHFVNKSEHVGVIPIITADLINRRLLIKEEMMHAHSTDYDNLNQEQDMLKRFTLSFYGIFGSYTVFRLPIIMESIASRGRQLIMELKKNLEQNKIEIKGGDCDSLMTYGNKITIVSVTNKFTTKYPNMVIKVDDYFDKILYISKKCYYGLRKDKIISKGTTDIKKTMSFLTKQVCLIAATHILKENKTEEIIEALRIAFEQSTPESLQSDYYSFDNYKLIKATQKNIKQEETIPNLVKILGKVNIKFEDLNFLHKINQ